MPVVRGWFSGKDAKAKKAVAVKNTGTTTLPLLTGWERASFLANKPRRLESPVSASDRVDITLESFMCAR